MSNLDLTKYKADLTAAAREGLRTAAAAFRDAAENKARDTFPGQTGATFAGVYATVSGASDEESVAQAAIQEVLLLNPLFAYTEAAPPPPEGVIRMWGSVPTTYIADLEADPTHAFLARTLDEEQGGMKSAVDQAVGGVV